jgi:hypothetical protein
MFALVPEVHLFICLDAKVAPGPVLQCLDLARAQDWQQETVLLCDQSWKPYVNIDQPVIYVDKEKIFSSANIGNSLDPLEELLQQLDSFEVQRITQVGQLTWGRWLQVYFEADSDTPVERLTWDENTLSSLQVMNDLTQELSLDISSAQPDSKRSGVVYVDPYDGDSLSPVFLRLLENANASMIPEWLNFICKEEDTEVFKEMGFDESVVELSELETSLFNQSVLCFSDQSVFSHTSRSYNIAIFGGDGLSSLFLPGDISIVSSADLHVTELFNILAYWRMCRLKELAFQWFNMGIEVFCIEDFHGRVVRRNLLNYCSDLLHCQILLDHFLKADKPLARHSINRMITEMRREVNNDPFALSFSLKILLMITERMLSSARCGERLFLRLGSDYHRITIGEALIEGLIDKSWSREKVLDIRKRIEDFHGYLIKADFANDQLEDQKRHKETA